MAIDAKGNYWLGTRRKGLFVFDPVRRTTWSPATDQLDISIVHSLQFDPNNNCIWIGSYSNGLYRFSVTDSVFRNIPRNDALPGAFHSSLINDIAVDRAGNAWAATSQGGLARVAADGGQNPAVTNYETKNGLPDNTIFSVAIDEKDQPWFTTSKGIGWMNASAQRKLFFNKESGLPYSRFQQSIACFPGDIIATAVDNSLFSFYAPALTQREDNNLVIDLIRRSQS